MHAVQANLVRRVARQTSTAVLLRTSAFSLSHWSFNFFEIDFQLDQPSNYNTSITVRLLCGNNLLPSHEENLSFYTSFAATCPELPPLHLGVAHFFWVVNTTLGNTLNLPSFVDHIRTSESPPGGMDRYLLQPAPSEWSCNVCTCLNAAATTRCATPNTSCPKIEM